MYEKSYKVGYMRRRTGQFVRNIVQKGTSRRKVAGICMKNRTKELVCETSGGNLYEKSYKVGHMRRRTGQFVRNIVQKGGSLY
ncbi:hypothetical protein D3P08_06395 [Paenibacillus nanensis]|uniref:Uncharacterized protein n=1 Tax=Paenibacillus nanensis TaxID=393251 RepID=A0A3A1V053_9BACL|nr:hypothetical protein D3P08_06395 [Paenibacillus nanensis]